MTRETRKTIRYSILQLVKQMADENAGLDYCTARERFALLGKIKQIAGNWAQPTAKKTWELVGLSRDQLVDEFEFRQDDLTSFSTK